MCLKRRRPQEGHGYWRGSDNLLHSRAWPEFGFELLEGAILQSEVTVGHHEVQWLSEALLDENRESQEGWKWEA